MGKSKFGLIAGLALTASLLPYQIYSKDEERRFGWKCLLFDIDFDYSALLDADGKPISEPDRVIEGCEDESVKEQVVTNLKGFKINLVPFWKRAHDCKCACEAAPEEAEDEGLDADDIDITICEDVDTPDEKPAE